MKAEIITIGDELLIGQVVNTNQAYIAEKLTNIGIIVECMITVADEMEPILAAFAESWNRSNVVIVTGGLGPTHDDITKKAVSTFFNTDLVSSDEVRRRIKVMLEKRSLPWSAAAEEQTMVPRTAQLLPNRRGTAAGMVFEDKGRCFIVLPGVPYEMSAMIDGSVLPLLSSKVTDSTTVHRTLRTTGISESVLSKALGNIEELLNGAKLAFLPSPTGVKLRITVLDMDRASAEKHVQEIERQIRERTQKYIYGIEDEELEATVGKLLIERGLTLAVAESCTGGLIADWITNVSGSSAYFKLGVVAYSDQTKTDLLGVPADLIQRYGAVSKQVAEAMALGARRVAHSDIAVSTTGIAGPTGATPEKPVGLVWIGYADVSGSLALKFHFGDDRIRVKERAAAAALELVRRRVLELTWHPHE